MMRAMRSKTLRLGLSDTTTWLAAYIIAHALRDQPGKQAFFKEYEKPSV